jgi:hypothetical protein
MHISSNILVNLIFLTPLIAAVRRVPIPLLNLDFSTTSQAVHASPTPTPLNPQLSPSHSPDSSPALYQPARLHEDYPQSSPFSPNFEPSVPHRSLQSPTVPVEYSRPALPGPLSYLREDSLQHAISNRISIDPNFHENGAQHHRSSGLGRSDSRGRSNSRRSSRSSSSRSSSSRSMSSRSRSWSRDSSMDRNRNDESDPYVEDYNVEQPSSGGSRDHHAYQARGGIRQHIDEPSRPASHAPIHPHHPHRIQPRHPNPVTVVSSPSATSSPYTPHPLVNAPYPSDSETSGSLDWSSDVTSTSVRRMRQKLIEENNRHLHDSEQESEGRIFHSSVENSSQSERGRQTSVRPSWTTRRSRHHFTWSDGRTNGYSGTLERFVLNCDTRFPAGYCHDYCSCDKDGDVICQEEIKPVCTKRCSCKDLNEKIPGVW